MWMHDAKTGEAVEVSDDAALDEWRSGRLVFAPGQRVPIIDPDGANPGTVTAEDLSKALEGGWSIEGESRRAERQKLAKFNTAGEEAKTFAEGALSGATLGLSRRVEETLLGNVPEQAARREVNPVASVAGEVAGAVASPVSKIGGAATGAARAAGAGRIAAPVIGGAVEGAVFGGAAQLTEDHLNNDPSTPGKVISSAGLGALFGGTSSGLFSLAGVVASKLPQPGVSQGAAKGSMDAVRDAVEMKAGADPSTFLGKFADAVIGKDRAGAIRRFSKDRQMRDLARMSANDADRLVIDTAGSLQGWRDDAREMFTNYMGSTRKEMEAALGSIDSIPVRQRGLEIHQEMLAQINAMKSAPADFFDAPQIRDAERQLRKIEKAFGIRKRTVPGHAPGQPATVTWEFSAKKAPAALEMFDAMDEVRRNFDTIARLGEAAPATQIPAANVVKGLRKGVREFLEDEGYFGVAGAGQARKNSLAADYYDKEEAFFGMFGKKAGYVGGKADYEIDPGRFNQFIRSMGQPGNELPKRAFLEWLEMTAKVAGNFSGDAAIAAKLSSTFSKTEAAAKLGQAVKLARALKQSTGDVEQAVQSSVGRYVFGAALGGMAGGPMGAVLGVAAPMLGSSVLHLLDQAIAQRGAAVRSLAKLVAKGSPIRDRAPMTVTKILTEMRLSEQRQSKPPRSKEEAYARVRAEIEVLAESKSARRELMASKLGPLAMEAPKVSAAVLEQADRAFGYLQSKLPKQPEVSPWTAPGVRMPPSEDEIDDFAQVYRAVSNPMAIMEDLASGRLSIAARDAVIEVYPDLYAEMQRETARALEESGGEIEYEQRLRLAQFFMLDALEPSLSPEHLRALQESYAPSEEGGGPGGPGGKPKLRSTRDLNSARGAASAADRIEGRAQGREASQIAS